MRAIKSHRRAIAIENPEVCEKPLLPGFRVSLEVDEFRIEIGVCGDGKISQRKRKPGTCGLQKSFLSRPAGKEARHAEMIRQRSKSGAFMLGEETLRQRGYIDILADFFNVDSQLASTANCN